VTMYHTVAALAMSPVICKCLPDEDLCRYITW